MKHSTLDQPLGLYPIRLMPLALLCWLLTAMPISAAQFGACDAETSLQSDQESFEVGSISIRRLNVFSEEQAVSWPYGLANKVHVITSDTLIRRQLLFQPGDVIDHHRFLESERWLRRNEYLSSASIRVDEDSKAVCNQPRDLIVTTQDQWSLTPHLSLASGGGDTRLGLGVTEKNLLGQGVAVRVRRVENIDRDSNQFGVSSRHLFGSRYTGRVWWLDSDDGETLQASLGKPFYSLDTAQSWQVEVQDRSWKQGRFAGGERLSERLVTSKSLSMVAGHLVNATSTRAFRWYWGAQISREANSMDVALGEPLPLGAERRQAIAFVGFQSVEDRFLSTSDVDLAGMPEDIRLGANIWGYGGYSKGKGAIGNRPWWKVGASLAPVGNERDLLELSFASEGFKGVDQSPSEWDASMALRWLKKQGNGVALQLKGEVGRSVQPFTGRERYLGTMSGLRGFRERLVAGATSTKLTVERRKVFSSEWFNVARLGWSLYADAGRVWDSSTPNELAGTWLTNVGIGLRVIPTRAEKGKVLHVDFAVTLNHRDHPDVDRFEVSVAIRDGL